MQLLLVLTELFLIQNEIYENNNLTGLKLKANGFPIDCYFTSKWFPGTEIGQRPPLTDVNTQWQAGTAAKIESIKSFHIYSHYVGSMVISLYNNVLLRCLLLFFYKQNTIIICCKTVLFVSLTNICDRNFSFRGFLVKLVLEWTDKDQINY